MQFDNEKLKKIIEKHRKYYLNEEGGERADLSGANLFGANLSSAKLNEETNITGESWKEYLEKVVPALLTAGGKTIQEIVESGCWNCHEWQNCPMHIAFGINNKEDGPILLRPRIKQFIQLFDFNLIPCPVVPFTSVN